MSEDGPKFANIDADTLRNLVAQYHHRMLSLEAELKDRARSGVLTASAFAKRVRHMKTVHETLEALRSRCAPASADKGSSADIGLPTMDACTPPEHEICEEYLIEREISAARLSQDARRVYNWLMEAVSGQTGSLRLTMRLSRLRRMIQDLGRQSEQEDERQRLLDHATDKLISSFGGQALREAKKSTLDGLTWLYSQLDQTISRVARLKATFKSEESRVNSMIAWLKNQEQNIRSGRPAELPPTPLAISKARSLTTRTPESLARSKERRRLVERFWEEVVHRGVPQINTRSMEEAARILRVQADSREDRRP